MTHQHLEHLAVVRDHDGLRSNAAYGVLYALRTLRAGTDAEMAIAAMSHDEINDMLSELLAARVTMGDTGRWLNARFANASRI